MMDDTFPNRKDYLGGTDIAAVCGVHPYKTEYEVWLEKTGMVEPADLSGNLKVAHGAWNEDFVLSLYEKERGHQVRHQQLEVRSTEHPFLVGHIDGKVHDHLLVEAKTVGRETFASWGGKLPVHYEYQVQHYMWLTGALWCDVAVLVGTGDDFVIFTVAYDERDWPHTVRSVVSWWEEHVIDGVPVEPTTLKETAIAYPRDTGEQVEATDEALALVKQYRELEATVKQYEEARDSVKVRLQNIIGTKAKLLYGGKPLVSWTSQESSRVDTNALRRDHPDLAEKYLTRSSYRVMRFGKQEVE